MQWALYSIKYGNNLLPRMMPNCSQEILQHQSRIRIESVEKMDGPPNLLNVWLLTIGVKCVGVCACLTKCESECVSAFERVGVCAFEVDCVCALEEECV